MIRVSRQEDFFEARIKAASGFYPPNKFLKIFLKVSQKRLPFFEKYSNINKLKQRNAEMSEWFKEHDWKSCDWENWSGGSNPLLCAKQQNTPLGVFFCFVVSSFEEDSRVGAVLREQNALP